MISFKFDGCRILTTVFTFNPYNLFINKFSKILLNALYVYKYFINQLSRISRSIRLSIDFMLNFTLLQNQGLRTTHGCKIMAT